MAGCPTCGAELTYVPQYGRHYCYGCRSYAPKNLHECETCGRALVFIERYRSHYCYGCQEYKDDVGIRNPCPECGEELQYLHEYKRFYCRLCKEYAPNDYRGTLEEEDTLSEGERKGSIGFTSFSREDMDLASKEELMAWCHEFGIDDTGMKYELRLRLLEHIRKQGLLLKGEKPAKLVKEELPEPEPMEAPTEEFLLEEVLADDQDETTAQVEVAREVQSQAQAPESMCANCGAELTFIPQYGRWYCYSCRTYAGAEPSPKGTPQPRPSRTGAARTGPAGAATKVVKKTGNPMVGIGLAAFGLILFVAEMLLFRAPRVFEFPVLIRAPDIEFALQFLSIVFIVLGLTAAIIVRSHR